MLAPGPRCCAPAPAPGQHIMPPLGSYLDPLLKNASGRALRTTSQKSILPRSGIITPLSPLTLYGTWSFGLSYSFKSFLTGTVWAQSKLPGGRVWVSKPCSPMGKPAGFECLLLGALGQESHSSRKREQQAGDKHS